MVTVERIKRREYKKTLDVVYASFHTFDAPYYTKQGCRSFLGYAAPQNFAARQRSGHVTFIARADGEIAGMIEIRNDSHISMLFVSPKFIKAGYGRILMEHGVTHIRARNKKLKKITVNAAPYAYGYYRHMGFTDAAPTEYVDGLSYTPMQLLL
jgi:ribosomal protein S18 acetylase RimI-like enzyme